MSYARNVDLAQFPPDGTAADALDLALRYAVLAPSSLNSQPWLFLRSDRHTVALFLDRERCRAAVDPQNREAIISCGAALGYIRLVLAALGTHADVTLLPEHAHPDLLARLRVSEGRIRRDTQAAILVDQMTQRHTNRGEFRPDPIPDSIVIDLICAAGRDGTHFYPATGEQQATVVELIREADIWLNADPHRRHELAAWLRGSATRSDSGVPASQWGMPRVLAIAGPTIVRHFGIGSKPDHDAARNEHSPLVAILSTPADTPHAWMHCGQALARVLLTAAAAGLDASFLNQPVEVELTKSLLSDSLHLPDEPQLVLRFGYPVGQAEPSARRPIEEVMIGEPPWPLGRQTA